MPPSATINPGALESVRQGFFIEGMPVAQWARSQGFQPRQVYAVLSGRSKGRFGQSHQIAVALGLKPRSRVETTLGGSERHQPGVGSNMSKASTAASADTSAEASPSQKGDQDEQLEKGR